MGICLVATSTLAYMNYSAKKHLLAEVGELTEQIGEAKEALEKMHDTICMRFGNLNHLENYLTLVVQQVF